MRSVNLAIFPSRSGALDGRFTRLIIASANRMGCCISQQGKEDHTLVMPLHAGPSTLATGNVKPVIEFFSCGHARYLPTTSPNASPDHDMQTWYAFAAYPSQATHLFTNGICDSLLCAQFQNAGVAKTSRIDNTVPSPTYAGKQHLKLQQRFASFHAKLSDIGTRFSDLRCETLDAVLSLRIPIIQRLFDL